MFKKLSIMFVLALSLVCVDNAEAKRGGGGFRSSRSSRPSTTRSRSTRNRTTTRRGASSKRPSSASRSKAAAERSRYQKAKSSGRAFKNKSAAVKDFRSRAKTDPKIRASMKKKYPTSYSKRPATRPSHIPQSYQGHNVMYQGGGYGYMNNGVFTAMTTMMLMSTMSNSMMASNMQNHGYYVGNAPPVVVRRGMSTGSIIAILITVVCGILVIIWFVRRS